MNQGEKFQPQYEDEIDLMDYVRVILKRKWLILAIFLGAAIVAGVFSFLMPKVYKIDTSLEIGKVGEEVVEAPLQVVEKIDADVYGILVREKLGVPEAEYPKIKAENPKDTNLVKMEIESTKPELAKTILEEINNLILKDHQKEIQVKKEFLEKDIGFLENNIEVFKKDIERIRAKIGFLEEEKKNLEAKVDTLQKILPYQQDPGTQFALFDTKEKLELKKQEIENRYLEINSLENKINSFNKQINSLREQIEDIHFTQIVKSSAISKKPVKPKLLLNIIIAAVLGIFIGIFLAFFQEWWEKSKIKI